MTTMTVIRGESNPNHETSVIVQNMNKAGTHSTQNLADTWANDDVGVRGEDKSTTTFKHVPNIVLQSDYAQCRTKALPPELSRVVKAWPELPEPIRAAILAMVKSATGEHP